MEAAKGVEHLRRVGCSAAVYMHHMIGGIDLGLRIGAQGAKFYSTCIGWYSFGVAPLLKA